MYSLPTTRNNAIMPRQIQEFWASASAQEHMLEKHGVSLEEALEAAESSPVYRRARDDPRGEKRYMIPGKTHGDRRLWIIFADQGDGRGRVITAREAQGRSERARHKRMRGD